MDRKKNQLHIEAVYTEANAPQSAEIGRAVTGAVEELATFLGAKEIIYDNPSPAGWQM
jgi:uncharacterized protein YcaQ